MTIIKTKKFILRPFKRGDEISLAENINDKEIAKNLYEIPSPYTLKDGKNWVRKNLIEQKKKNPKMMNFVIDINGEVAGSIGFTNIIKEHKTQMGYWLARKYWNKGIMTYVIKLATQFIFAKFKLKRIYAYTFPWNKASMKVLEKNKFKHEGISKKNFKKGNKFTDGYLFAKIK